MVVCRSKSCARLTPHSGGAPRAVDGLGVLAPPSTPSLDGSRQNVFRKAVPTARLCRFIDTYALRFVAAAVSHLVTSLGNHSNLNSNEDSGQK